MFSLSTYLPGPLDALARTLLGAQCYTVLLVDSDVWHGGCVRLAVSKGLGVGIIVFGSIIKVPQIMNIVRARSAQGISLAMYVLEVLAYTISLAYAVRGRLPFSTYGENASLTLQNMVITLLIIAYAPGPGRGRRRTVYAAAALMATGALTLTLIPYRVLTLLQATTIPISLASKVPQILELHTARSRGQLSALVVVAQFLGTIARVFTTATETNDALLLWGFALAAVFNALILAQVVLYWHPNPNPHAKGKGRLE